MDGGQRTIGAPSTRNSDIVDAVLSPRLRDPGEGSGVLLLKGSGDTQLQLSKGAVEKRTTEILILSEAPRTDVLRERGPQTAIGVHKKDDIRLTRQPGSKGRPPIIPGGIIYAGVGGMSYSDG